MNTLRKEEGVDCIVVKSMTIIALNKLNTTIEVSKDIAMKIAQGGEHFRFKCERESPQIMSKNIQTHEKIFRPRNAHDRRCPQIIVNQLKGLEALDRELEKGRRLWRPN